MEYQDDKEDGKVLVNRECQSNQDAMEHNTKLYNTVNTNFSSGRTAGLASRIMTPRICAIAESVSTVCGRPISESLWILSFSGSARVFVGGGTEVSGPWAPCRPAVS